MTDDDRLRDVDLWTLRTSLTDDDRRLISAAWRNPEPVARDSVLSAIGAVAVRKIQRAAVLAALFWGFTSVWAVVAGLTGAASFTYAAVYALCVGAMSAVGAWTWLRARRARQLLVARTDVAAASRRARELRALRSGKRNERSGDASTR